MTSLSRSIRGSYGRRVRIVHSSASAMRDSVMVDASPDVGMPTRVFLNRRGAEKLRAALDEAIARMPRRKARRG